MTESIRIDGIVERISPTSFGHQHGLHVLMVGHDKIYHFNSAHDAYEPGVQPNGDAMAALTQPGDHVWFELKGSSQGLARQGTLRNWTLEHRLFGKIKPLESEGLAPVLSARHAPRLQSEE